MSQGYGRANTDRGATKARIENFAAPLMIDFEAVLTDHLPKVIKDISHREAALSLNKLLHDKEIKAALIDRIGMDRYQLLTGWEQTLIQDRPSLPPAVCRGPLVAVEAAREYLRRDDGVEAVHHVVSVRRIRAFLGSGRREGPDQGTDGIHRPSAEVFGDGGREIRRMRHRMDTLDRDIKEALLATRGETASCMPCGAPPST
jgi:hypothetical protein